MGLREFLPTQAKKETYGSSENNAIRSGMRGKIFGLLAASVAAAGIVAQTSEAKPVEPKQKGLKPAATTHLKGVHVDEPEEKEEKPKPSTQRKRLEGQLPTRAEREEQIYAQYSERTEQEHIPLFTLNTGEGNIVHNAAVSPDGQTVVTIGQQTQFWDAKGNELPAEKFISPVQSIVFSPTGKTFAAVTGLGGYSTEVRGSTGGFPKLNKDHIWHTVKDVAMPDDHHVIYLTSEGVFVQNIQTGEKTNISDRPEWRYRRQEVEYSPASRTLATADMGGKLSIWQENILVSNMSGVADRHIAFNQQGTQLATTRTSVNSWSGDTQQFISVWNADGSLVTQVENHPPSYNGGSVRQLLFTKEGLLVMNTNWSTNEQGRYNDEREHESAMHFTTFHLLDLNKESESHNRMRPWASLPHPVLHASVTEKGEVFCVTADEIKDSEKGSRSRTNTATVWKFQPKNPR